MSPLGCVMRKGRAVGALFSAMVVFLVAFGAAASAQNVSRWDGTYRCIQSQSHCVGGWFGTIRISGGRISGHLSADLPGGFYEGTLSGRIDSLGEIDARLPMYRPYTSREGLDLNVQGSIWEASVGRTKRRFFGGATREIVARLRFITPAQVAEMNRKDGDKDGTPAPRQTTTVQRSTTTPSRCKAGQGSFAIREAPNNDSRILRSGGGCLDNVTFQIARRHTERWVVVQMRDGRMGYVELNNAPLTAFVAAALEPKPPQAKVAEAASSCSAGHVTYTLRTAASSDAEAVKTEQVCIDDLDLIFVERVARSSWYAVREPGGPQRFVDVADNISLASLADRRVFRDRQEAPRASGQQQTATSATCRIGVADYTIRALPLERAPVLESRRGCLDDVAFEVVSTTVEADWYLVRLPTGRVGYVNAGESAAMARAVAARIGNAPLEPAARTTPPRVETPLATAQQEAPRAEQPPALEPVDQRYVAIKNANIRISPNVRAALVETLPKGTIVTALGRVRDADWFLIAREGEQLGYVFAPLVALEGSPAALAALAPPPPTRPAVAVNRHAVAVIIGNRRYGGDVPDVSYAHNDADLMKRHVIEVLGYREGNIIDLRDATLADFNRVFGTERSNRAQLANWIRDGRSDVTVFYSGHGVPGLSDGRGYLLPVDGDPNLAELTGYSLDTMVANLNQLTARSVQVFVDACFSGNSAGGTLLRATSGIGISPALPDGGSSGLVVITAASGDQVASWDDDARQGLFTRHLLAALSGRADGPDWGNGDGQVTLGEVKSYLDDEMTFQARKRFNRHQTATISGGSGTVLAADQ